MPGEPLSSFLTRVFSTEKITNVSEGRAFLEEKFLQVYHPRRDLMEYLEYVQKCEQSELFYRNKDFRRGKNEEGKKEPEFVEEDDSHKSINKPRESFVNKGFSSKQEISQSAYFDKCKKFGRVGPLVTKIDENSIFGDYRLTGNIILDVDLVYRGSPWNSSAF